MIGFPKSTEFNRRIPKQKFYENLSVSPTLKRVFIDQIKVIYWRNKVASTTMNLAAGDMVAEIEVFEIQLNGQQLEESVLRQIDKRIPYYILFILEYEGKYQAWIAYKEVTDSGSNAYKVGTYYHTDWMTESELPLKVDGLNVDKVYENFVRQIAGDALRSEESRNKSLKESVERDNRRRELEKQIAALQTKVRKEKQLNKQVQLNAEIKKLKKELEELRRMSENYWKDAYQSTWEDSSKREKRLKAYLEKMIDVRCTESGLGAGISEYISGSAARNGYQKGDADLWIEGTNVYIEVTGPLTEKVQPSAPLWFRPDKIDNAIKSNDHDVFFAHHCVCGNCWRVIHVDQEFKNRYQENQFKTVFPQIRGRKEKYVEIEATDKCVRKLDYLLDYLKRIKGIQING